jgi:hypothetical protein
MAIIENRYDQSTDTHLAKKYNDVIFDCMTKCNITASMNRADPHYSGTLLPYFATVETFYINTFFLFESIYVTEKGDIQPRSVTELLQSKMDEASELMDKFTQDGSSRTKENFFKISSTCYSVHKLILYGLNKRNMLVRTSDREPRGKESIKLWDTKAGFKKGGIMSDSERKKYATKTAFA